MTTPSKDNSTTSPSTSVHEKQTNKQSADVSPTGSRIWSSLPPWVTKNLKAKGSRQKWLRCWLACWVSYIILLPNASLRVLGNAGFFALLVSVMLPANMPVQLFLFVLTTLIMGMCLGWGIGAAAMRAALASRNQLVLQASLQRELQSVAGLANPDALFQADIFQGKFLDTKSSIVFGCFLGLGSAFFALIRAYAPKLTMMSVFGTIALDIFCSYGPLFPFAEYTLLNSVLTATACYIAIGIVVITFIFPETINHAALVSASALVAQLKAALDAQHTVLKSAPEDLSPGSGLSNSLTAARAGIIGQIQALIASTKFIGLEFSWGKWNAEDVTGLHEPLTAVVSRTAALHSFTRLVGHQSFRDSEVSSDGASEITNVSDAAGESYLLKQLQERNISAEAAHSVRMKDILPVVDEATIDLRSACSQGLEAAKVLLDGINTRRWARSGAKESQQHLLDLDQALEQLRKTLAEFQESKRLILIHPFESVIECVRKKQKGPLPFRTLFVSFVFAANLISLAQGIEQFMIYVQTKAAKRTRNRLWAPGGLRAIAKALASKGDTSEQAVGEDTQPTPEGQAGHEEKTYRRDPDSRPPTNFMQRVANTIHHLYKWTKTPEALFVFRYTLLTIALWIPAVCKTSAHFVYAEKGLWSLIMAQTTINIYASDQIFNLIVRISGTFFGAMVGLVTWYIGSGSGNGNVYGSATVVAISLIPIIFLRIFAPPQYLVGLLLFCATWVLVVGYSWLDGHLLIVGNPGLGWSIAWRRLVTVLIGAAASFIIMMFPPKSGRKAVRLRNASILMSLSSLYTDITAAWISASSPPSQRSGSMKEWNPRVREKVINIAGQLQALRAQTAVAQWEGNIRGVWPMDEYVKLANAEGDIMASLALLGGALAQLDNETRLKFLRHTMVVNPNFIADVTATFSLVASALRTGEPLPQAFHQNLQDRLHYHGRARHGNESAESAHDATHKAHIENFTSYDYMFYASAISAVFQVLEGLNECRAIVTRLCGEVPLDGWARWKDEYERVYIGV